MNILGMGTLEVLVVLLVAFIFLGPERMVSAARVLGKVVAEARRMTAELPELMAIEDEDGRAPQAGATFRGPHRGSTTTDAEEEEPDEAGGTTDDHDGPVAFRPGGSGTTTAEEPPGQSQSRPCQKRS